MTPELTALTLAALLQVVQYGLYAVPANLELGPGYTMSARDREPCRRCPMAPPALAAPSTTISKG